MAIWTMWTSILASILIFKYFLKFLQLCKHATNIPSVSKLYGGKKVVVIYAYMTYFIFVQNVVWTTT